VPGAPNRPPEIEPANPSTAVSPDAAGRHVLRRLAPSRVALHLEVWKGAPHADLMTPFERAESLFTQKDYPGAEGALDQLSVRFAEPRWPTMPLPFRNLRVVIAAPQPPQWDPEFALSPPEREQRRAHREAERQLALARGCVDWANAHGVPCPELAASVAAAETAFGQGELSSPFWDPVDRVWAELHERVPLPTRAGTRPPTPPPAAMADSAEGA
jgi:hypothetical protein